MTALCTVARFLSEIQQLYAVLSTVSKYPRRPEFEEERTTAALALIQYLRHTHRADLYTKYVHFLVELHTSLDTNHAEAAYAQLLHVDVLDWSDAIVPAVRDGDDLLFPQEPSSKRFERVLVKALHVRWHDGVIYLFFPIPWAISLLFMPCL